MPSKARVDLNEVAPGEFDALAQSIILEAGARLKTPIEATLEEIMRYMGLPATAHFSEKIKAPNDGEQLEIGAKIPSSGAKIP